MTDALEAKALSIPEGLDGADEQVLELIRVWWNVDGPRMNIRPALESDFSAMWPIFQKVVASGTTYVFAPDSSTHDAFAYWFAPGVTSFVAEDNEHIVGMYKLIPNQRDLGSHVANASFMVSPEHSGKGTGEKMGWHCLREAKRAGFLAIQYNFVVSTNKYW